MSTYNISTKNIYTIVIFLFVLLLSVLGTLFINPAFLGVTGLSLGFIIGSLIKKENKLYIKKYNLVILSFIALTAIVSTIIIFIIFNVNGLISIVIVNAILYILAIVYLFQTIYSNNKK